MNDPTGIPPIVSPTVPTSTDIFVPCPSKLDITRVSVERYPPPGLLINTLDTAPLETTMSSVASVPDVEPEVIALLL
jgi:hypothetical protein